MKKIILLALIFLLAAGSLFAQSKTALLIANGNYKHFSRLNNPVKEANQLKAALQRIGFKVTIITDADKEEMYDALYSFEKSLKSRGGIAFFHYGGHAVQVDGQNYLVPVDADIPDERRVKTRALDSEEIMATLDASGSDANIVILDACRNNPLPGESRGAARGLAVVGKKPKNSIIVYSAESGTVAQDGVFTPALIKFIETPNTRFSDVLLKVRKEVYEKSKGAQTPGSYNQLFENIYLAGKGTGEAATIGKTIKPKSATGSVQVTAGKNGRLYMDGEYVQSLSSDVPTVIDGVSPGSHVIEVRADDNAEKKTVTVQNDKIVKVGFELASRLETKSRKSEPKRIVAPLPKDFVLVKGGTFRMGSTNGRNDEKPVHRVTLADFVISKYEVTQALYKKVMGKNPSFFKDGGKLPVETVSWYDAVNFCNKMSNLEGRTPVYSINGKNVTWNRNANGYRLLTEAEWEYAARGGSKSHNYKYSGSDSIGDIAWWGNDSGGKTHPVGQKRANELGLYDMSGNVCEWCWDWYGPYSSERVINPIGSSSGTDRISRGGWYTGMTDSQVSSRLQRSSPDFAGKGLGFRLALNAE